MTYVLYMYLINGCAFYIDNKILIIIDSTNQCDVTVIDINVCAILTEVNGYLRKLWLGIEKGIWMVAVHAKFRMRWHP